MNTIFAIYKYVFYTWYRKIAYKLVSYVAARVLSDFASGSKIRVQWQTKIIIISIKYLL